MHGECGNKQQTGLTIVELMISMALSLLIIMAAMALFVSSKAGYVTQDEGTRLQDTGRYAIENISRALRQAGYENWDKDDAPIVTSAALSANIIGLDARSLKSTTAGLDSPVATSINGSDVLAIRFFGAGSGLHGDGTVLNCAGFGIPAPNSADTADEDRGWSIFYVAADQSGESELRCKYYGKSSWSSQAVARGVESFQVLYGIDSDADGLPNQFLTATEINSLDAALSLVGSDDAAKLRDRNKKTYWKKVVAIKLAILVRGSQNARSDALITQYDLFGPDYSAAHAMDDKGTLIKEKEMPFAIRNRLRKVFSVTIQLRNQIAGVVS